MDLVVRFLVGGALVSLFALIADVLKPRGFAGLFGAAPLGSARQPRAHHRLPGQALRCDRGAIYGRRSRGLLPVRPRLPLFDWDEALQDGTCDSHALVYLDCGGLRALGGLFVVRR